LHRRACVSSFTSANRAEPLSLRLRRTMPAIPSDRRNGHVHVFFQQDRRHGFRHRCVGARGTIGDGAAGADRHAVGACLGFLGRLDRCWCALHLGFSRQKLTFSRRRAARFNAAAATAARGDPPARPRPFRTRLPATATPAAVVATANATMSRWPRRSLAMR